MSFTKKFPSLKNKAIGGWECNGKMGGVFTDDDIAECCVDKAHIREVIDKAFVEAMQNKSNDKDRNFADIMIDFKCFLEKKLGIK